MSQYGLSALMEAMKQSESAEKSAQAEQDLMESIADDEVKRLIMGDDTVENDMEGNGIGHEEEKELEDFIKKIPASEDDAAEEEEVEEALTLLEGLTESLAKED